jgi:hypothetical protein
VARREIGPVAYETYRQRVRRHRRTDVIVAVAALNTQLERAQFNQAEAPGLPNVVAPFTLGGVARTALVSGNDHRDRPITLQDLVEMCAYYANVEEPALEREPGLSRLRFLFNHIAYEQSGHQFSVMENVGRTLVLLADHAVRCSAAPTPEDWTRALGVPLEQYMRLGFAMHVAALSNGGSIEREVLRMDHVAPIFRPLTPDDALDVIDRWFAASPDELRAAGASQETPGAEKWSLSPLVARPLVALPDGRYVMPWPRLVLDRITPTGLYFIGLDVFGEAFTVALGAMFQDYVGSQLALLEHADVRPEIVYGRSSERTVDFFIIVPEMVLLVEVKAARPVWATRLGVPLGDEDTAKKVGYAFTQIERTVQLIRNDHSALATIPRDRPLRGLVVTLEPFHLVNTDFYDDVFQRPSIPTTVASSHELEGTVAVLRTARDTGPRLLDALTPTGPGSATSLGKAGEGLPSAANPLLDDAWRRFTEPRPELHGES